MAMKSYRYVVIGGGMTADAAVHGIREVDPSGEIGLIGSEPDAPYNRPPLSKGLWKGKPLDSVWRHTEQAGVALHLRCRAAAVDPVRKTVVDEAGDQYSYEKLLLATGGTPRRLPFSDPGVIYFRTLDDYRRLREQSQRPSEFAVIGGGFIGSEVAAALAMNGHKVSMIFPDRGIGARIYPSALSEFLNTYYQGKGVTVFPGDAAEAIERKGEKSVLRLKSGKTVSVDGVVAGIGIQPSVDLAQAAGLTANNGIVVDEMLCTTNPDIYAAGDVANFYNPALESRLRVEHEDNANTMGAVAGRNMAGRSEKYNHLSFFYSDLFELGYEAVGELDPNLELVEDWKERFQKGVVYYLKNGQVRGVLLWNTWGQVDAARHLITAKEVLTSGSLIGRISD
jgi:3-phenylpropionate/trans-cinnamate dioxygenase ferredoxin reductase component